MLIELCFYENDRHNVICRITNHERLQQTKIPNCGATIEFADKEGIWVVHEVNHIFDLRSEYEKIEIHLKWKCMT